MAATLLSVASVGAGLAAVALAFMNFVLVRTVRTLRHDSQEALVATLRELRQDELRTRATVERLTEVVTSSQAWFWTDDWQAGEREADADLAEGRVKHFDSEDDMDAALDAAAKEYADTCNV